MYVCLRENILYLQDASEDDSESCVSNTRYKKCLNTEVYGSLEGTQLLTKLYSNTKQELVYYKEIIQSRQKTVYFNY